MGGIPTITSTIPWGSKKKPGQPQTYDPSSYPTYGPPEPPPPTSGDYYRDPNDYNDPRNTQ